MISVLIADGNLRLADLMGQLLDDDPRFGVIGVATTVERTSALAIQHQPDVILVSQHLYELLGTLWSRLRAGTRRPVVLLWSSDTDRTRVAAPDVDGLLERGMTYQELAKSISRAYRASLTIADSVVDLTRTSRSTV